RWRGMARAACLNPQNSQRRYSSGRPLALMCSMRLSDNSTQKALDFAAYHALRGTARGQSHRTALLAEKFEYDRPRVFSAIKAVIPAGVRDDSTFAGPLTGVRELNAEFVSLVAANSLVGKVAPSMIPIPFQT